MKNNFYVEFNGGQVSEKEIRKKLKELWVSKGQKIKDINEIDVYLKVDDNTAYCIVNKSEKIVIEL